MTCMPRDLIAGARALYDVNQDEATARAVVSRAYYGAYHAARNYHQALPSPGSVVNANGKHNQLISQLRYPTVSGREKARSIAIGNLLLGACALRVNADYEMDHTTGWYDAHETLSKAEQILTAVPQQQAQAAQA